MITSHLVSSFLTVTSSLAILANGLPSSDTSTSIHERRDISYNYHFKELTPQSPRHSNQQKYFRAGLCFKKNPGISEEAYHKYWKTVHADKSMSSKAFTVHISRYNQFHMDSQSKKALKPLIDQGMKFAEFDGCAEFLAPDAESFVEFVAALPDYLRKDEQVFVDEDFGLYLMAGYENVIYGSGIRTSKGTDGILPHDHRLSN